MQYHLLVLSLDAQLMRIMAFVQEVMDQRSQLQLCLWAVSVSS